jgi:AraC-like DNA-binding protein
VAVVLDTSGLPPGRRADAVAEVIRFSSSVPTHVVYNCPHDEVSAQLEYFTFGDARLLTSRNSSQGLVTTPALLKGSHSDLLVVSVKLTGTATLTQAPGRLLRRGDLFVTDLWRPFEFVDQGGANAAFYVCLDRLGLSRDYAARAGQALHLSPMASQLQRHFQILLRDADAISQSPAAAMIGQATTDLVRAALVAGADEEPFRSDGWEQNLITVAKSYISQHLAEPDVGAEAIARALFISVRQVYKLWETEPRSLGQWILERRLDAARRELTSPRRRNQTIAAIAGRWGFVDATHFSRRFRQAYGMSPREWRQACHRGAAGPTI